MKKYGIIFIKKKIFPFTFNEKGGIWNYIDPPKYDANDELIKCSGECSLHLHGITDVWGPFYSTPSAVGLIMVKK